MKKVLMILLVMLMGCSAHCAETPSQPQEVIEDIQGEGMKIKVTQNNIEIIYTLNDSNASKSLYDQLPLEIAVENYSNNEKIYYPPHALDTSSTPLLQSGDVGTLAYFAPWDDVVMFYGSAGPYNGLYILGEAIEGKENIKNLSGKINIEKVEE